MISGRVQGRRVRAYETAIRVEAIQDGAWEMVERALLDSASHTSRLAAGELTSNIEDVFAPHGVRLFPGSPLEVGIACECGKEGGWCKHAVALAYLFAGQLVDDPLAMLALRGCPIEELRERLRSRREVSRQREAIPVYVAHLEGLSDRASGALEEELEDFWETPESLEEVDLPIEAGEVSHPLLRRLGQSPFAASRFPLVGLLATCYDLIGARARAED